MEPTRAGGKRPFSVVTRNWWTVVLRGLAHVAFGIVAFTVPTRAVALLVKVYAVFALVNGVVALVGAVRGASRSRPWLSSLAEAVVSIGAGVVLLTWPGAGVLALTYVFAFWAVFSGIAEIIAALELRKEIEGEWFLATVGVLSVVAGVLVAFRPMLGAIALAWIIGTYAVASGAFLVALGFRLRAFRSRFQSTREQPRPPRGVPQPA